MPAILQAIFGSLTPILIDLIRLEPRLSPVVMYADLPHIHAISAVLRLHDSVPMNNQELAAHLSSKAPGDIVSLVLEGDPQILLEAFLRIETGAQSGRFYRQLAALLNSPCRDFVLSNQEINWQVLGFAADLLEHPRADLIMAATALEPSLAGQGRDGIEQLSTLFMVLQNLGLLGEDDLVIGEIRDSRNLRDFVKKRLLSADPLPAPWSAIPDLRHINSAHEFLDLLQHYQMPDSCIPPVLTSLSLLSGSLCCHEFTGGEAPLLVISRKHALGVWQVKSCFGQNGTQPSDTTRTSLDQLLEQHGIDTRGRHIRNAVARLTNEPLAPDFDDDWLMEDDLD